LAVEWGGGVSTSNRQVILRYIVTFRLRSIVTRSHHVSKWMLKRMMMHNYQGCLLSTPVPQLCV